MWVCVSLVPKILQLFRSGIITKMVDKKPLHEFMFAELKVILKKLKLLASGNKAGCQNISSRFQLLVCGNEPRRPRYSRRESRTDPTCSNKEFNSIKSNQDLILLEIMLIVMPLTNWNYYAERDFYYKINIMRQENKRLRDRSSPVHHHEDDHSR